MLNAVSLAGPSFLVVVSTRIFRPANGTQEEAMSAHLKKSRRKQKNFEYDKKKDTKSEDEEEMKNRSIV